MMLLASVISSISICGQFFHTLGRHFVPERPVTLQLLYSTPNLWKTTTFVRQKRINLIQEYKSLNTFKHCTLNAAHSKIFAFLNLDKFISLLLIIKASSCFSFNSISVFL